MEYRRLSLAYGSELEEVTSLSLVLVEAMVFSGILTAQLWGGGGERRWNSTCPLGAME